MAKANKKADKAANKGTATAVVTVKELAEEFGVEARELRALIRSLGFKAPATGIEGFGPRAKYEWSTDSKELAAIRKAVSERLEAKDGEDEGDAE